MPKKYSQKSLDRREISTLTVNINKRWVVVISFFGNPEEDPTLIRLRKELKVLKQNYLANYGEEYS